jgi:replication factor C subunit 3/5
MAHTICAKWYSNSMPVMTEVLMLCESKLRRSPVRTTPNGTTSRLLISTLSILGTKQIFSAMPKAGDTPTIGAFKLIILDEADAMTSVAQMALRRIMEKYTANTRFCIIANYTHKLSPALLSRCTRFRFSPLKEADIRQLVDLVIEKEEVKIQPDAVDSLVRLSKGDMRRALNVLQACHASSKSAPDKISVCGI